MDYEVVIGLEVHSQLRTNSKMFCSCAASYQEMEPNTLVCPVCMGMPGSLPVINKEAVRLTILTGLALNCAIGKLTKFDRKNYPYPDLMKGYQISQFDRPIANLGHLSIGAGKEQKTVGITRVHLEEDVAKLLHRTEAHGEKYSLLDINRSGVPLMEIVSEPDMRSPEEARSYLTKLHSILQYTGVSTANMEEGSFRCDANISVRPRGSEELGSKVEIKNMNSFRSVYQALHHETQRQTQAAEDGIRIVQETRGWVEDSGVTVSQRSKEYASDYRYFPDPDIPPIFLDISWIEQIRRSLPELPAALKARLIEQYQISDYDSEQLTQDKSVSDFFEKVMDAGTKNAIEKPALAKSVVNWILGEMTRLLNAKGSDIQSLLIRPADLIKLIDMVRTGMLNSNMAKEVFEEMFNTGNDPESITEQSGVVQISDTSSIEEFVDTAICNNPQPVADYIDGKDSAMKFLMGQVMKSTSGKANPQMVTNLLKAKLDPKKSP
ncbi:MAG: Asp-tRNA(Asn)/Glu-tRNA(Gln) amidotransferase subunit GatB [Chloroflexota bacterium]|nr:Asp-tRNA(Asn)/Glu-tRNA(Gln) amidotransferase subunit GatB [Chloroflexota bacterium]